MSQTCKLYSKVIINRRAQKLDDFYPEMEQVGFWIAFNTITTHTLVGK